jgi:hypothetical protein
LVFYARDLTFAEGLLQPETALGGDGPTLGLSTPNGGAEATLVSSAAGAAGALAGWAISSIGKKVSSLIFDALSFL